MARARRPLGANLVINDYVRYMRRRGFTPGTIERRSIALTAFARWLEPAPIIYATSDDIVRFLDSKPDIVDRTRACWISHLKCYFTWATLFDLIDVNPALRVERPRLPRLLPRPIGEDDLMMAMEVASPAMHLKLVLGAYAGLRCMEMANLNVDCILMHDAALRVMGKGRCERIVPMHSVVEDALLALGVPRRGAVLTNGSRRLHPREISTRINVFLHGLGIDATAHMLRHRFGTQTYAACKDLRVTQELLGHASPTTTAGYAAFSRVEARRAVLDLPIRRTRETAA